MNFNIFTNQNNHLPPRQSRTLLYTSSPKARGNSEKPIKTIPNSLKFLNPIQSNIVTPIQPPTGDSSPPSRKESSLIIKEISREDFEREKNYSHLYHKRGNSADDNVSLFGKALVKATTSTQTPHHRTSGSVPRAKEIVYQNEYFTYKKKVVMSSNNQPNTTSTKEIKEDSEGTTVKEIIYKKPDSSLSNSNQPNFFSTPRMPFADLTHSNSGLGLQKQGSKSNRSAARLLSTQNRTPRKNISQEHILAITENRANEIGIAAFNLVTGEITISQISDNHTYVHSKKIFYDETKGYFIYSNSSQKHITDLDAKYLGFAALNALCSFLEYAKGTILFYPSLKIDFYYSENFVLIDLATIESLELLLNNKTKTSKDSLIECFECQTVGGSEDFLINLMALIRIGRLLRAAILQPLNNKAKIEARFDAVDEIIGNQELIVDLRKVLKSFDQCDNVAAKFIQKIHNYDCRIIKQLYLNIVSLYHMLNSVENFAKLLADFKAEFFQDCLKTLSDPRIKDLLQEIKDKLYVEVKNNPNEKLKQKIYYLVKNESNEFLDLARVYYTQLVSEMYQLHQNYQQKLHLQDLQLINQETRGYCLFFNANILNKFSLESLEELLEDSFVQITKKGKGCLVQTKLMESLNLRIKESCNEILTQTQKTLEDLLAVIHVHINMVFNISDAISQIDMILSFASFKLNSPHICCRPTFNNELLTLATHQSRHPVIDKRHFVPNDYFLSPLNSALFVFGRSGSGKTVYAKQLALIVILAQIGCPVPAEGATLLIYDRLFTRIGANDNLELNESSLYFELSQTQNIFMNVEENLANNAHRTLLIADGFAKSTSSDESFAITYALVEHILQHNNVNLVLTVNDKQMLMLASAYKAINCVNMKSEVSNGRVVHHYKAERVKDLKSLENEERYDVDFLQMPKKFREDFKEAFERVEGIKSRTKQLTNVEDKYIEKMKEFLWAYSQIVMKGMTIEERNKEILELRKVYFKE